MILYVCHFRTADSNGALVFFPSWIVWLTCSNCSRMLAHKSITIVIFPELSSIHLCFNHKSCSWLYSMRVECELLTAYFHKLMHNHLWNIAAYAKLFAITHHRPEFSLLLSIDEITRENSLNNSHWKSSLISSSRPQIVEKYPKNTREKKSAQSLTMIDCRWYSKRMQQIYKTRARVNNSKLLVSRTQSKRYYSTRRLN